MPQRIQSFGGESNLRFSITDEEEVSLDLRRVVWFDKDIDEQWIVWAMAAEDAPSDEVGDDPEKFGAIIVRDPAVTTFIEQLGDLLAHPERYEHDPVFSDQSSSQTNDV